MSTSFEVYLPKDLYLDFLEYKKYQEWSMRDLGLTGSADLTGLSQRTQTSGVAPEKKDAQDSLSGAGLEGMDDFLKKADSEISSLSYSVKKQQRIAIYPPLQLPFLMYTVYHGLVCHAVAGNYIDNVKGPINHRGERNRSVCALLQCADEQGKDSLVRSTRHPRPPVVQPTGTQKVVGTRGAMPRVESRFHSTVHTVKVRGLSIHRARHWPTATI